MLIRRLRAKCLSSKPNRGQIEYYSYRRRWLTNVVLSFKCCAFVPIVQPLVKDIIIIEPMFESVYVALVINLSKRVLRKSIPKIPEFFWRTEDDGGGIRYQEGCIGSKFSWPRLTDTDSVVTEAFSFGNSAIRAGRHTQLTLARCPLIQRRTWMTIACFDSWDKREVRSASFVKQDVT